MSTLSTNPAFAARANSGESILSECLAFAVPFFIGTYWLLYILNQNFAILILRPAVVAMSLLWGISWYRRSLTIAEAKLAGILAIFCTALLIPSIAGTDVRRSMGDWIKVVILCILCLLWTRALRDPENARKAGVALTICACILTALILTTYFQHMGFVLPTYQSVRGFKGLVEKTLPLNAVPFAAVLAYLLALCIFPANRFMWFLGCILVVVSTVFTGSRAPIAILLVSALILALILAFRDQRLYVRMAGWVLAIAFIAGGFFYFQFMTSKQLSKITEGRWDLWYIAWTKFTERPLVGYGYGSWDDDLWSRLPGFYQATKIAKDSSGGSYHNEYLQMLAEQGLVGSIPAVYFFGCLFYTCWKLAFYSSHTWTRGCWALFACLVILTRACLEIPGLFGYGGQDPVDYLCFFFVAVAFSRLSIEEDYLRASQQFKHQPAQNVMLPASFRSGPRGIANL